MQIEGEIIEIGRLEDGDSPDGVVVRRDDGSFVTVTGLSRDEVRALAPNFLDRVTLTISA